ncbi:hypothetical protein Afil01_42630 [Actinorhabdospora filicis]|uniref:PLD phosphodiesterase domain-containing protein n=2 Tax=Actinorhabdospora filicis TaxID=1785913 RepID=A0A9W6SNY6_9ACTN|nr:hypothetical protein Afil01_42630 [Actinorhabdospora filicis]
MVGRSEWFDGLIAALDRLILKLKNTGKREFARVGKVAPDPGRGPGWFRFEGVGAKVKLERLTDAVLAPNEGPQERQYAVIESLLDDGALLVKASATASGALLLWAPAYDKREQTKLLREGLDALPQGSLADRFAERHLDPLTGSPAPDARFNPAQLLALRACVSPGLQLVWGPPGTGKTHVIAEALAQIIAMGRSVLLVSTTNIAVDNAVEKVAGYLNPDPGVIVRVGTPSVREVATDPRVALPLLIQARQAALQRQIEDVLERIDRLRDDPRPGRYDEVERRIASFDLGAYDEACRRAEREHRHGELQQRVLDLEREQVNTTRRLEELPKEMALAELVRCHAVEREAEAEITATGQTLDGLRSLDWWTRFKQRKLIKAAKRQHGRARLEHAEAVTTRRDQTDRLSELGVAAPEQMTVPSAAEARKLSLALFGEHDRLPERLTKIGLQVSAAKYRAVQELHSGPLPTTDDEALLARAEREGLAGMRSGLPALQTAADTARVELRAAEREYEQLQERMAKERADLAKGIIQEAKVVATTLATSVLNAAVRTREYDYVVVDEAAFCRLPEVVHAVGKARIGAVLVGDFLQNRPILDPEEEKDDTIKPYFDDECFAHFQIRSHAEAEADPGCVVLTEQHRFGRQINDLVNRAVYEGALRALREEGGEVVFIDVDGLGSDLVQIHRSGVHKGHWSIGGLLTTALAEQHMQQQGESFGVIVPYKDQEEATRRFLEAERSPVRSRIDIGTAHAAQGREFDVVLFDLVEDGKGRLPQAARSGRDYDVDGLRLFNVAVTRARKRVYVAGLLPVVQRATTGPLRVLREMIEAGEIGVVKAAGVLGYDEVDPPPPDTPESDVWEALKPYVRIVGQYDQVTVMDAVGHALRQAETSVWVWSPWVGKYQEVQDLLVETADRGVRVTVFCLAHREINEKLRPVLDAFIARFPGTVRHIQNMHQKLVLVDGLWTFQGSMNLLSAAEKEPYRRKETMLEIRSAALVAETLRMERAEEVAAAGMSCPKCAVALNTADIRTKKGQREWSWVCTVKGCRGVRPFAGDKVPHQRSRWPGRD